MPEKIPDTPDTPDGPDASADATLEGGAARSSPPRQGRTSGIVGHTLKGYRVLAKIGEGGMGAVFRALDEGLDREVAIKVLPPSLAREESFRMRFLREARALARVKHPNLVQIYTVAADKGLHFFAMEYVRGSTLGTRVVRDGPMSREAILAMGGQVLAGSAASFVSAYFAVRFLTRYFHTRTLTPFGVYCVAAGAGALIWLTVR